MDVRMTDFFPAFASCPRPPDSGLVVQSSGADGNALRSLLAATAPADLLPSEVRVEVTGNLWMLAPEAFRYFLPAFLQLSVDHYDSLGIFVSELVGALTEPSRDDMVQSLDRAAQIPAPTGLAPEIMQQLRQQQLEWFDSGAPLAKYRERIGALSASERMAVLDFLATIRESHGADFPFDELQIAIDRLR